MLNFFVAANTVPNVFGQLSPPPGGEFGANPIAGISTLVIFGIQMFLMIAGLAALFYMMWGAFEWVTSGGEQDKLEAARSKMTNAVIGIILTVVALGVFVLIGTDILRIFTRTPDGDWIFKLPTINSVPATGTPACIPSGQACSAAGQCCAGTSCKTVAAGADYCMP